MWRGLGGGGLTDSSVFSLPHFQCLREQRILFQALQFLLKDYLSPLQLHRQTYEGFQALNDTVGAFWDLFTFLPQQARCETLRSFWE